MQEKNVKWLSQLLIVFVANLKRKSNMACKCKKKKKSRKSRY